MKLKMKHRTAMFQRINTLIINSLGTKMKHETKIFGGKNA